MDDAPFQLLFGIKRYKKPTKNQSQKAHEINQLFDEMREKYGLETRAVFQAAADELCGRFLRNVIGCPRFVIYYCQQQLKSDALAELARRKALERKRAIEKTKRLLERLEQTNTQAI